MEKFANRKFAAIFTALVMAIALFFGVWGSFASMRRDVVEVFDAEIMPHMERAIVAAFNVHTVAANYLDAAEIARFDIAGIVASIQNDNEPVQIYEHYFALYNAVWDVYEMLANRAISDANRNFINNYHRNFREIDLILRQSDYNRDAGDFNETLTGGGNLGFLARLVVDEMPRFDNEY